MKHLLLVGIVVAAISAACAFPTTIGPTGGVLVPNAEIQKGISVGMDYYFNDEDDEPYFPLTKFMMNFGDKFEVGAGYSQSTFYRDDYDVWTVFGKYALPYTIGKSKLAVGAIYVQDDSNYTTWSGYLTGTWPVFTNTAFTAGVMFTDDQYEDEKDTTFMVNMEKTLKSGAKVGIEWLINVPDTYNYGYEFLCSDSDLSFGNVYVTIPVDPQLSIRLGLTNITLNESGDVAPNMAANFTF